MQRQMSNTPFTFVEAISWSKQDLSEQTADKTYVQFIINRHLSLFKDVVMYANELNVSGIPNTAHFYALLNTVPKRKRFAKWNKREKETDVENISLVYQCNHQRAREFLQLLNPKQLEAVNQLAVEIQNVGKLR
jgi:hypothetical protein